MIRLAYIYLYLEYNIRYVFSQSIGGVLLRLGANEN